MLLCLLDYQYVQISVKMRDSSIPLQRYRKMLGKIHAKEDRVLDLDDVLKYADANADGVIDFEEWRQDLIKYAV